MAGTKIFIGGLPHTTTEDMLAEVFGVYGTVVDTAVMRERDTQRPRGFGFVTFAEADAAQTCVANDTTLEGRVVDCKLAQSKEDMKGPDPRVQRAPQGGAEGLGAPTSGKVFVGGLSPETTDESLADAMSEIGEVTDVMIGFDKITGRSRGFGFVTFADPSCVKVLLQTSNYEIDGKVVEVKQACAKTDRPQAGGHQGHRDNGHHRAPAPVSHKHSRGPAVTKIFVGGLPPTASSETLTNYFRNFGDILDATIMYDKETNRSRGFGFVEFEQTQTCSTVTSHNNHHIDGKWVDVKVSIPEQQIEKGSGKGQSGKGGFQRPSAPKGGKGFSKGMGKGLGIQRSTPY